MDNEGELDRDGGGKEEEGLSWETRGLRCKIEGPECKIEGPMSKQEYSTPSWGVFWQFYSGRSSGKRGRCIKDQQIHPEKPRTKTRRIQTL